MRRRIRRFTRNFGYDIIEFKKEQMGIYPFYDMAKFVNSGQPMLFDIGANVGQTVKDFKEVFRSCTIHSFEPSPDTFEILKNSTFKEKNVHIWNYGIGAESGELILNEYQFSNTNSFLNINDRPKKKTPVKIITVDEFCEENKIEKIDILKIDTEGFELEVLKGSNASFSKNKIGLLFFEISFSNKQNGTPAFTELCDFALNKGFELVSIYPIMHRKQMAAYTNILFKHKSY